MKKHSQIFTLLVALQLMQTMVASQATQEQPAATTTTTIAPTLAQDSTVITQAREKISETIEKEIQKLHHDQDSVAVLANSSDELKNIQAYEQCEKLRTKYASHNQYKRVITAVQELGKTTQLADSEVAEFQKKYEDAYAAYQAFLDETKPKILTRIETIFFTSLDAVNNAIEGTEITYPRNPERSDLQKYFGGHIPYRLLTGLYWLNQMQDAVVIQRLSNRAGTVQELVIHNYHGVHHAPLPVQKLIAAYYVVHSEKHGPHQTTLTKMLRYNEQMKITLPQRNPFQN